MFQYRPVTGADIQAVCSFPQNEEELFYLYPKAVYPLTPEQLQAAINQRSDSTVVEPDGEIAGFANFYRWQGGKCCIGNLVVAPQARDRGVAKYLVRTMVHLAGIRHAATWVEISCFNHNTAGLLLYRKLGFEPFEVEEREGLKGRRVVLIHMRLRVADARQ